MSPIYKTLVLTGLRKGELSALTMGRVELEGQLPCLILDAAEPSTFTPFGIPSAHT